MPEARNAILHLPGEGGIEAALVRDLVAAIDDAHSGYVAFDRIVGGWERDYREGPFIRPRLRDLGPGRGYFGVLGRRYLWERPGAGDAFTYADERLIVVRVELGSPGVWEFLGMLNPLEVARRYLNDRHKRRQDRAYREREEERRLGLENDLREIDVIRQRLELAQEYGVPDDLLVPLLEQLIGRPLRELGALQDRGVIDGTKAEIKELPRGETPDAR